MLELGEKTGNAFENGSTIQKYSTKITGAGRQVYFLTTCMTSSSCITWVRPTRWGEYFVLVPCKITISFTLTPLHGIAQLFPTYPDKSKLEDGGESSVNCMTDVLHGDAVAEDDSVFEIWWASWLLRVDSNLRLSMIITLATIAHI